MPILGETPEVKGLWSAAAVWVKEGPGVGKALAESNALPEALEAYQHGIAVAEVKNGACGSCSMKLRPQMVVDIKVGNQILTCENCNRILYIVPTETVQTA